jgi:hypothetical protein
MDFTASNWPSTLGSWLWTEHAAAIAWFGSYVIIKGTSRVLLARTGASVAEVHAEVWDPVCLGHNVLSVIVGMYTLVTWGSSGVGLDDACRSVSDPQALVILLQTCHSATDYLFFFPQMVAVPIFLWHHGILMVLALVLPRCQGCFYAVMAFAIAEFGSGAIGADAEWRRSGRPSRGKTRVVIFGGSRLVDLLLLRQIWLVTPRTHEFSLWDDTDGILIAKADVPVCLITAVGGSALMLCVNGLTWWRMFRSYRKVRAKSKAAKGVSSKRD